MLSVSAPPYHSLGVTTVGTLSNHTLGTTLVSITILGYDFPLGNSGLLGACSWEQAVLGRRRLRSIYYPGCRSRTVKSVKLPCAL